MAGLVLELRGAGVWGVRGVCGPAVGEAMLHLVIFDLLMLEA